MSQHKDAFALGWIAAIIRWFEDLVNLLSGPLLTVGLGIALVALLTDGQLLARIPILLYVWAISQAVGVDAQLVATWDRARIALREHRYWALVGLISLGAVLAYIAWIAAQVFALQESAGITTGAALSRLGMDSASWLVQRTALQVFLVALAGWTRYHKPAKDTAAEKSELQAELELEPMRGQLRRQQARGVRGAWDALRGKETPALPSVISSTSGASANTTIDTIGTSQLTNNLSAPDASTQAGGNGSAVNPHNDPPSLLTGPGTPVQKRRSKSADMSHPEFGGEVERTQQNLLSYYRVEQTDSARRFLLWIMQ
ncbi:MAG TPA: hypothetical protein VGF38_18955 [Ktedonobacterales bacterium]